MSRSFDLDVKQVQNNNNLEKRASLLSVIGKNINTILTVVAVILGIGVGIALRSRGERWSKRDLMYLEFPGELFLRGLKCLILPLIVSSLISALGSLESSFAGKIGTRAVSYYFLTTVMAIGLGIILVLTIHPGVAKNGQDLDSGAESEPFSRKITTPDTVLDLIRNLVPTNLIEATFAQYSTVLTPPAIMSNDSENLYKWELSGRMGGGTNILGLVSFSILLGLVCGAMGDAGKPIVQIFASLSEASMKITSLLINFTPIGVMFLVMPRVVEVDDVEKMLGAVGWYTFTVLVGLFVHGLIVLPFLYLIFVRRNPFSHLLRMSAALMTAFGTSSSSATLPVTINCLETKSKLDSRIVRFVVPVGATVNMDGTALYEAVAAIFIAQSRGIEMSIVKVIIVSITATAASIGAAGIPQAGLVTMVIVLNAVGLPAQDVALIFVVDWFLDRFRTVINVLGDTFGAAVIHHWCIEDILAAEGAVNPKSGGDSGSPHPADGLEMMQPNGFDRNQSVL